MQEETQSKDREERVKTEPRVCKEIMCAHKVNWGKLLIWESIKLAH